MLNSIQRENETLEVKQGQKDNRERASLKKIGIWPKKVKHILQKLDIEKAKGPDSIPARVLKQAALEPAKPLDKLYCIVFSSHTSEDPVTGLTTKYKNNISNKNSKNNSYSPCCSLPQ